MAGSEIKHPVREFIRVFKTAKYKYRVWIDFNSNPSNIIRDLESATRECDIPERVLAIMGLVRGVNAIEFTDCNGEGEILYPEWP